MKHLILLLLPFITRSEVSVDFSNCADFFLNNIPPDLPAPAGVLLQPICQCLWGEDDQIKYLYATLYSTTWKIPVYSAYVFGSGDTGRCDVWYIEPQLDGESEPCMRPKGYNPKIGTNQALISDYKKSGYDKGHVYPVMHTNNPLSMLATSTLTNAAPQNQQFNRIAWRLHESAVLEDLKTCEIAYVVAGVVPDTKVKVNNKITVAKFYWRATCCLKGGVYTGKGYYGPDNNGKVQELSVQNLQKTLNSYYQVKIFPSIPNMPKKPKTEYSCN